MNHTPIFNKKILQNYINKQDETLIDLRWPKYQKYLAKIDRIKDFKEEEYQDGFLQDIFEDCLGYISKTKSENYTLEREKKNETDSKKADGVIYIDDKVVGVIELKAQNTKNLDNVQEQAFWYLNQNSNAKYVIISNFNELRFYIEKSTSYEKFSLFELTYEDFKKLHLLLSYESIKDNIPLQLKAKSNNHEQQISKELYKDFSNFRTNLFQNLIQNNPHIEKSKLLRLTQKLCDRIIFILFAEDRGLLTSNTIKEIREDFTNQKFSEYTLYDIYKFYFNAINQGNEKLKIPKYNGGLFSSDKELDSLIIDNDILDIEAQKLSDYDFESEVGVNILGHIFEQSLTDLEELQANIDNVSFDKTKTKRKKDGVFYTPSYITKYIVDNTLAKICLEKREELSILEVVAPKNPKKLNKIEQQTKDNLETYKEWLLALKILDPACGSGAFLNQALDYLITEHTNLQNDLALMGDLFSSYTVEQSVLENNLYGVDINEDAVEIAKLSLWLRTAKKGRSLTSLADKILCANSLLDMPFEEGSFDIVAGNPPYVRVQGLKSNYEDESKLYEEKFESATGKYDLYVLFLEMSFNMLNKSGKLSYILPHKFLISDFGSGIRGFLSEHKAVENLLHFGSEMVFEDASTYTCIITLSHNNEELKFKHINPKDIFDGFEYDSISYDKLTSNKWNLTNQNITKVLEKINQQVYKVKDVFEGIYQGIVSCGDSIFMLRGNIIDNVFIGYSSDLKKEVKIESSIVKPILKGKNIKRNTFLQTNIYIIFPHYLNENNKTKPFEEEYLKDNYPLAYEYLLNFKDSLVNKKIKYKTNEKYWYSLHRSREITILESLKIITPQLQNYPSFTFDEHKMYSDAGGYNLIKKENIQENYKYFLTLLNSSIMWFFIKNTSAEFSGGYYYFKTKYLEPFPLPKLKNLGEQEPFIQKADLMLELNKNLQKTKQNFINELELEKIPKKLQSFEELEFDEFVKVYKKAKKLKFADKLEERNFKNDWEALFENDKKEALEIQSQINKTDDEIDTMVYKLYGLSDEEIKIVEA
ncbi:MAG: putative type IIS restriction/modification enzyme [uncultured Campylobacterales bacterium]|uniref:site-specific DNA-methyltransferase (adenine-specific) n=1 Tax=uncultured Campylobacterales bacterium TaxID=352960 RepID=A0A6S6SQS9_9BACT|nr:MAG: putative type IIS restriction/modification enzyme [uncultured Campylobacterales bacterium]